MKYNLLQYEKRGFLRTVLFACGTISLGLGILGIFLPLLPTTPFLILAAILYARSSQRLHRWIMNNRLFGRYIKNYVSGGGIPLHAKVVILIFLWVTIGISAIFVVSSLVLRIVLACVAVGVSIHIVTIRTLRSER
jgi:uncharacterized membrane protein YbaN (DUF454 family)